MHNYDSQAPLSLSEAAAVGIGGGLAAVSFGLALFCFSVWAGIV